jgi:MFS family permease
MTGDGTDLGATGGSRLVTRPFLLVTAVTFLFFVYVGIQIPLIPRLVERGLGGSELDIGLNLAAFSIAAIAIRPLLGTWGDRYGRRVLMIVGSAVAGVAVLLMALVDNRWMLLPLRGLAGMGEGAVFVGAATMISDLAPAHRRAEAASYLSVAIFGGIGVGPIIGEPLISGGRFDRGLVVSGLVVLAAAVCALAVPNNQVHPSLADGPDGDRVDGASEVRHQLLHRGALRPGAVLALGMAGFATFNAFLPDHVERVGLRDAKWVFAVYSVVCLVVRLVGARVPERMGLGRAVSAALVFLASGLVTLAAAPTPTGVYAGTVLIALGMAFMYPALMAITVNAVPESQRSRVISSFTMFFEVGTAAGGILFGAVAELAGKRGGFLAGGISAAFGLWVLWRMLLPTVRAAAVHDAPVAEPVPARLSAQFTDLS